MSVYYLNQKTVPHNKTHSR